ncbi:hypothetical protein PM082_009382 [Marasmius tenuissimus]|nr:hypothetical protein PM082_009382 [Marasmius tenuissimus]
MTTEGAMTNSPSTSILGGFDVNLVSMPSDRSPHIGSIHGPTAAPTTEWSRTPASHRLRKDRDATTTSRDAKEERQNCSSANLKAEDTKAPDYPDYKKPTPERSWEAVMKEVGGIDEGVLHGWKEDIDTLLVFAGLFSAVVTAFTIESYQWLEEGPEDATVALLRQISQQMNNTVPTPVVFEASASNVRINTLWFLSLIIALVDALFGLLCKQWLREHRRPTHTRTPAEALTLRWLRHESLEKWHVPTILASLPILLEIALFLFLAGVLELLWARHPVPFALALMVIGAASLFYLGTTIAPGVDIIRQALQITPELRGGRIGQYTYSAIDFASKLPPTELVCPYKSPQAWAAFKILRSISFLPGFLRALYMIRRQEWKSCLYRKERWAFTGAMSSFMNWSSVDLEAIQRSNVDLAPPFHELNAFRWLVAELRDTPIMLPHLQNILGTLPIHLVMPAVLDRWFFPPEREWTSADITTTLHDFSKENFLTFDQGIFLESVKRTKLFTQLLHYNHVLLQPSESDTLNTMRLYRKSRFNEVRTPVLGFPVSFRQIDEFMKSPETMDLGSGLWALLGRMSQSPSTKAGYWAMLMHHLAQYIISSAPDYTLNTPTTTTSSHFFNSEAGVKFLSQMNTIIIDRNIFQVPHGDSSEALWIDATDIVRRVHRLPTGYFRPLPGYFPLPLSRLEDALNSPSSGLVGPETDFGYLNTFMEHWSTAESSQKEALVGILSKHVNGYRLYFTSDRFHTHVDPVIMSSAGLSLMSFINHRMMEDRLDLNVQDWIAWIKALEHIRLTRGLTEGYFATSIPMDNTAGGSGDRDGLKSPSDQKLSPHIEDRGVPISEDEHISVRNDPNVVVSSSRSYGDTDDGGQTEMGGPNADNNI